MSAGFLSLIGLASAGRLRAATEQAARSKIRATEFKAQLETARDDVERWKRKVDEGAARLTAAAKETERWKSKDAGHLAKLNALLEKFRRLESAEQHVELARGHLLSMETKLDVIEGAITVLDRRTREEATPADPDPVPAEPATASNRE